MAGLALFPLHHVLFPGGSLRLRVFEQRYLDLVRQCTREQVPFGVCAILEGAEAGGPAVPAAFGTSARIVDFHVGDDGLLGIVAEGQRRFHVDRLRVRDNGLMVAEVAWQDETSEPVRAEHGLLVTLLTHILERAAPAHAATGTEQFDDAGWVGYRLAELLPISNELRQCLLQSSDPHERLQRLLEKLPALAA
ncbi:MAG: LON peptidase substrate-binding domain-containing protein [Xanthomonadales bacterium]|nr:LON peptidase substrate-binding domain-containing protein [Xanthomonadales bacterium]